MRRPDADLVRAAAAGVAFVLLVLIALLGGHGCTPARLEEDLRLAVERELARQQLGYVAVDMDGQVAVLDGVAPSQDAAERAEAAALRAAGDGGPWAGGVSSVRNDLQIGDPVSPYTWRAVKQGSAVRLEGYVPSARAQQALTQRASAAGFEEVSVELELAAGAPGGAWAAVAMDALDQLSRLQSGEARLSDDVLIIMGEGDAASLDALRAHYRGSPPPDPFRIVLDVTRPGESPVAGLEGIDLSEAAASSCQTAFSALLSRNVINFDTNSTAIDPASRKLLENLAAVARRCDRYGIAISGHTDNVGERDLNMALSEARAQAVSAYLVRLGVRADRLATAGFGPDQPVASNDSEGGRARNRRIEFQVTS